MNFIELTNLDDTPVVVNLDNVTTVVNTKKYTLVWFNTEKTDYIEVKESLADIQSIIESMQRRNK